MADSYCIVIPHYRHLQPLQQMLPRLVQLDMPVYIVDDASGPEITDELNRTAAQYSQVSVIERAQNGGKGAAMITGLKRAATYGHSHAISLDADGQHDLEDIPQLHKLSREAPHSLFSGRPVFGDDIPASRLYGRMLTNYLVQLVTASRMVRDAMCGLRVYPLTEVLPLCEAIGYRTRMEFDVEILVRACWAGLDVRAMDTTVIYPQDGASHFNLVADNVRLVAMHALLIIGGLLRLPRTLWRRRTQRVVTNGQT